MLIRFFSASLFLPIEKCFAWKVVGFGFFLSALLHLLFATNKHVLLVWQEEKDCPNFIKEVLTAELRKKGNKTDKIWDLFAVESFKVLPLIFFGIATILLTECSTIRSVSSAGYYKKFRYKVSCSIVWNENTSCISTGKDIKCQHVQNCSSNLENQLEKVSMWKICLLRVEIDGSGFQYSCYCKVDLFYVRSSNRNEFSRMGLFKTGQIEILNCKIKNKKMQLGEDVFTVVLVKDSRCSR